MTQKELAERMDRTQPTISALEAGDVDRSGLATLNAYVEALGGTVKSPPPSATANSSGPHVGSTAWHVHLW